MLSWSFALTFFQGKKHQTNFDALRDQVSRYAFHEPARDGKLGLQCNDRKGLVEYKNSGNLALLS
jgi:hypothetical protein